MDETTQNTAGPIFSATKKGPVLEFTRDPHPGTSGYLVVEAPGVLVLFPKDGPREAAPDVEAGGRGSDRPDRDGQLRRAFSTLRSRVPASAWASSNQPYTDLVGLFRHLDGQAGVREDVSVYLDSYPAVRSAVEMLFTSVAMSARADWRSAPLEMRGVVARGWFLGRWIPTFLVLDGPVLRFVRGAAFRRQQGSTELLRAVRAFFSNRDFILLRHAFAHWSFLWSSDGVDSEIVGVGRSPGEHVRVSRGEADAFHIVTFALVEAIHEVFLESRPAEPFDYTEWQAGLWPEVGADQLSDRAMRLRGGSP